MSTIDKHILELKVVDALQTCFDPEIPVNIYELQRFCSEGAFELKDSIAKPLFLNEYVLLRSDEGKTMPARYYGDNVVRRLKIPDFVKAIRSS